MRNLSSNMSRRRSVRQPPGPYRTQESYSISSIRGSSCPSAHKPMFTPIYFSWLSGHPIAPPHLALLNVDENHTHHGSLPANVCSMETGFDYFSRVMSVREGGLVMRMEAPIESGSVENGAAGIERQEYLRFVAKAGDENGRNSKDHDVADGEKKQTDWFATHAVVVRDPILLQYVSVSSSPSSRSVSLDADVPQRIMPGPYHARHGFTLRIIHLVQQRR